MFDDPQVRARGLQLEMEHARAGAVPIVASPIRLSDTPVDYRISPPELGAHTDDVLSRHLRLSEAQITALKVKGVLA
ncbi:Formyl-CoA:oxalate CoA-transferase [bioreactor metagenome]|uniref:Formyl-CoA:oxalate CoA-transferase n=1 Tax=bioreactor metagenome TaxID=1076179 RepID=A0A645A9D4_9ZZZZ